MHELQIDTKISTHEIADAHRPMVSRQHWSDKRMKQMIPVWNCILKRSDAKKKSVDEVSANSGNITYTYTSQSGPSDKDNSTISSQLGVTGDANASFTWPIAEDLVHSNTILADEHSIIGSNISFGIESPDMPTYANVDQVLIVPECLQRRAS